MTPEYRKMSLYLNFTLLRSVPFFFFSLLEAWDEKWHRNENVFSWKPNRGLGFSLNGFNLSVILLKILNSKISLFTAWKMQNDYLGTIFLMMMLKPFSIIGKPQIISPLDANVRTNWLILERSLRKKGICRRSHLYNRYNGVQFVSGFEFINHSNQRRSLIWTPIIC